MTDKITLEEALKLVEFEFVNRAWRVKHVQGSVWKNVYGSVYGYVRDDVDDVGGNVREVGGIVHGTISGCEWQFVETPREKLKRLIEEGADKDQLLKAFNQLENN